MNEDHMEQVPEIPMDKDIFEQQRWILDRTVEFARNAEQKASILFGVFAIFFGIFMSSDVLSAYLTQGRQRQCRCWHLLRFCSHSSSCITRSIYWNRGSTPEGAKGFDDLFRQLGEL